ncbi:MAG: carboxypeptidase regulatory-like domain-containing protein [Pseudomonadota bacterium]|nr:carboxypeptidase regulatory-like domain-containing protein [Pseudomonadota bacterium]
MKKEKARFAARYLTRQIRQTWKTASFAAPLCLAVAAVSSPALAQQQTGSIKGQVTAGDGSTSVAGIQVVASSPVMPKDRSAKTREDGTFTMPFLVPGEYEVTFTLPNGDTRQFSTRVLLEQASAINFVYSPDNTEVITITGSPFVTTGDSSLTNSFGAEVIQSLPTGQTYRDMLKILPGVEYSENGTLGPSAGGSGVDNSYGFDGVDLSMPMFGNLSSEPSTHDIASVSVDRGGAKAVGFNRSGGFAVNSVSKSGTNEFHGSVEYRIQPSSFSATPKDGVIEDTDSSWIVASVSGPLIEDELYFYGSFYRPVVDGSSKETAYGATKDYKSERNEYFGKLTWAPTADVLLNASIRDSERNESGSSIGEFEADSVSVGSDSNLSIYSLDGSWLIGDSSISFKYGKYKEDFIDTPDTELTGVTPVIGDSIDISALDEMGYFSVPSIRTGDLTADDIQFNTGALPLVQQYGYVGDDGEMTGGGGVGAYSQYNRQSFERESFELAFDTESMFGNTYHTIHAGFKWEEISEDLARLSNGWGFIEYVGGIDAEYPGAYYVAQVQQMSLAVDGSVTPSIVSSAESFNFEINDTIEHGDFTYNVGLLVSKDVLYGQGLAENSENISGYEVAPGNPYKMYTVDWKDMVQPRLGVTWEYEDESTVFANYASYNPNASSLARAASWDRNSRATVEVQFDENGDYLTSGNKAGSSGKFFADNMRPRRIDEYTVGTTRAVSNNLMLRSHVRFRYGSHFWEDMPNNARLFGEYEGGAVPEDIAAKGLYIDNLDELRAEVGGSSYVVAEVDGGQTKYWEWSTEAEWYGERTYLNASYTWSHYYGNFDQDSTTTTNDANNFIGSSYYGDGVGRMPWDNRYGKLIGDKPHKVKVFGYYTTDWDANIGAYFIFQSGEAWTAWDGTPYGYASGISRYAEPAGSRRGASHWQLDMNYTQNWDVSDYTVKFRADLFNVFNKQTGYDYNPYVTSEEFGQPRDYYNPRRLQLSVTVQF